MTVEIFLFITTKFRPLEVVKYRILLSSRRTDTIFSFFIRLFTFEMLCVICQFHVTHDISHSLGFKTLTNKNKNWKRLLTFFTIIFIGAVTVAIIFQVVVIFAVIAFIVEHVCVCASECVYINALQAFLDNIFSVMIFFVLFPLFSSFFI